MNMTQTMMIIEIGLISWIHLMSEIIDSKGFTVDNVPEDLYLQY